MILVYINLNTLILVNLASEYPKAAQRAWLSASTSFFTPSIKTEGDNPCPTSCARSIR